MLFRKDPLVDEDLALRWDPAPDALRYDIWRGTLDSLWQSRVHDHQLGPSAALFGFCNLEEEDPASLPLVYNSQTLVDDAATIGPAVTPFSFYYLIGAERDCASGGVSADGSLGHADIDGNGLDEPYESRPWGPILDGACQP